MIFSRSSHSKRASTAGACKRGKAQAKSAELLSRKPLKAQESNSSPGNQPIHHSKSLSDIAALRPKLQLFCNKKGLQAIGGDYDNIHYSDFARICTSFRSSFRSKTTDFSLVPNRLHPQAHSSDELKTFPAKFDFKPSG